MLARWCVAWAIECTCWMDSTTAAAADPHPNSYPLCRSNGKFRSTPHRVLPAYGKERLSIPFFFEPNLDTRVEPLESCKQYAEGALPFASGRACLVGGEVVGFECPCVCVCPTLSAARTHKHTFTLAPHRALAPLSLMHTPSQAAQGKVYEPVLFADHLRAKVTNNFSFLP